MFVVSEFKNGIWREILATHIETDARALLKRLGTKGKVEETQATAAEALGRTW